MAKTYKIVKKADRNGTNSPGKRVSKDEVIFQDVFALTRKANKNGGDRYENDVMSIWLPQDVTRDKDDEALDEVTITVTA